MIILRCPRCQNPIVYNGNYFCSSWATEWCGWKYTPRSPYFNEEELIAALKKGEIRKVSY